MSRGNSLVQRVSASLGTSSSANSSTSSANFFCSWVHQGKCSIYEPPSYFSVRPPIRCPGRTAVLFHRASDSLGCLPERPSRSLVHSHGRLFARIRRHSAQREE